MRQQPRISFLRVPDSKVVKNRLHLDLQVGCRGEAWDVRRQDGTPDHVVMADPEGNEFRIL